jgi:hypothetical protein
MSSLRDAQSAAHNLAFQADGEQKRHLETIARAFAELEHRFAGIEDILNTLTKKAGVSAADVEQMASQRRAVHSQGLASGSGPHVRRILK